MGRSKKSVVWNYFIKTRTGGQCKLCERELRSSGNTTNLLNHLKRSHNSVVQEDNGSVDVQEQDSDNDTVSLASNSDGEQEIDESPRTPRISKSMPASPSSTCSSAASTSTTPTSAGTPKTSASALSIRRERRQSRIDNCFSNIISYQKGGDNSEKLLNAITFMIAKDNLPMNTTEKIGFQYVMKVAAPHFALPGRSKIANILDNKYEALFLVMQKRLSNVEYFSITTDGWTDSLNSRSFMGVTVHYIHNGKLCNLSIDLEELSERHTGENLCEHLKNVLGKWTIPLEKIQMAITDNGANMVKAITLLLGASKHLPCFAHTINLIPKKVCEDAIMEPLITSVKSIVRYFKQSNLAAAELRKLQESSTNQNNLKLIQSNDTRWNSTFYMLERFLDLSDLLGVALLKFPDGPQMLSARELQVVKEVLLILQPFEMTLKELEGDEYVTSSKVIPAIYSLKKIILSLETVSTTSENIKKAVLADIEKRFGKVESVTTLAISTILDPRFKRMYFENPLAVAEAVRKIKKMVDDATSSQETNPNKATRAILPESEQNQPKGSIWIFHESLLQKQKQNEAHTSKDSELTLYLQQNPVSLQHKFDPIQFWHDSRTMYPTLSKIALQHLSTVATSASSERMFSRAGNIMDPARNRLTASRLGRLLFLNSLELSDWQAAL